ncbi:MAG TPA: glycosyltransferase [Terriglobales bacterium]|jgi:glycosyltransferase involved in cell wall biosynthesis|nr:glycosyltransferase [Terriglobales bacterium]
MHLFLNGVAASAGAGLTYLRNVVPELAKRTGVKTTVAVSESFHREWITLPNISLVTMQNSAGAVRRFWYEQTHLSGLIRDSGADVLVSTGNFALRTSPVPQILLSGNSLYTSKDFLGDLRCRGDYRLLLDTKGKGLFAKRSVIWADCAVAPSEAFAKELSDWTGTHVKTIHHGFDRERFFQDGKPLADEIQRKLDAAQDAVRLLFVSHYNYYRNFETLFRAIPILQERMGSRPVKLFLTCKLAPEQNPGSYRTEFANALVRKLKITDSVVELGAVPYEQLHGLYRSCHIYTTAAYTETFAHPLVEAMASELPVVASDLNVHREVCGEAALYFERFSPKDLAMQVWRMVESRNISQNFAAKGLARSRDFSWQLHVDQMLALAGSL